ncbi:MAG: ComEC/Rec2 family competence protein [Phycisphaerales bacterium]
MQDRVSNTVNRRGLYAFAAIAAGIVLADQLPTVHPAVWFAAACVTLACSAILPRRAARSLLATAALLLGAGSMSARVLTAPAERLTGVADGVLLIIRGTVGSSPAPTRQSDTWEPLRHGAGQLTRFELALSAVQSGGEWSPASGQLSIFVRGGALPRLEPGSQVEVIGHYRSVRGPANPGERDARRWAAQEARCGWLTVESPDAVQAATETPGPLVRARAWVTGTLVTLHARADEALTAATGEADDEPGQQSRALLRAMLIGDEDPAVRPVSDDMSRLGIVHILSISGFHLVLVAMIVVFLIRLTGDRGVWEYALAAAGIGLYLLIVPAQAPVVRSGVMVLALLLTEACGRRYDRLNILAWTACALALWRPLDIYSPGFQLSFGVTAVLIWRASDWTDAVKASGWLGMPGVKGRVRTPAPTFRDWLTDHLAGLTVATALAWSVSAAVVAWHVGVLSLLGVVAGIVLTIPSIAAIALGFIAMLASLLWRPAGETVGNAAVFFSDLTVRGSHLAAQMPGAAIPLPHVPLAWTVATTCVAVAAVAPGGWRRVGVRVATLVCTLWLAGILIFAGLPLTRPMLDRFALPKSSASLLQALDQAVFIDPGSASKASGAFTLRRAASACGAWHTRTAVITGPQTERFDHLPELVRPLGIETVLVPPGFLDLADGRPDGDQDRLLRALRRLGVTVRTLEPEQALSIGDLSLAIESPGVLRITRGSGRPQRVTLEPLEQAEHFEIPS